MQIITAAKVGQLPSGKHEVVNAGHEPSSTARPWPAHALHGEVVQLRAHLEVLPAASILGECGIGAGLLGEQAHGAGAVGIG
jgi:hypothetical protein